MRTRADVILVLDSSCRRNLKIIEAWRNSSLVVNVYPKAVYSAMSIRIGNPKTKKFIMGARGTFHPVKGYWYFYIPRNKFLYGGETMYEIDSVDVENLSRHVCGDGILRINSPALEDTDVDDGSESSGNDAYVNSNGNWYLISIGEDDEGGLTLAIKDVATSAVPADVSGEAYAYNKKTGLYHKITVEYDDTNTPMLVANSVGVDGDSGFFAYNHASGLYYRLETEKDETGAQMLQIGDVL